MKKEKVKDKTLSPEKEQIILDKVRLLSDIMTELRVKDEVKSEEYPYKNLWDEEEIKFFKKNIIKLVKKATAFANEAPPQIKDKTKK